MRRPQCSMGAFTSAHSTAIFIASKPTAACLRRPSLRQRLGPDVNQSVSMILIVDNTIEGVGSSPAEIRKALQRMEPDMRVVTEPFQDLTPEFVKTLAPSHIILSGQSHPWTRYSSEMLAGIFYVIREARQPILGVCGGQQQMALAFGAPVDLIERLAPGVGYDGAFRERGFTEVQVNPDKQTGIFSGLPGTLTV